MIPVIDSTKEAASIAVSGVPNDCRDDIAWTDGSIGGSDRLLSFPVLVFKR